METRKIQMVSGGTYTVSLPKEWAVSEGISTGSVVNLHTHLDGLLVVQAPEYDGDSPPHPNVLVDDDDSDQLEQTVRAAYAAGTTRVVLTAPDGFTEKQRRHVQEVTRSLTGVTIVDKSESQIVVRTLLDPAEVSIHQSVRQLQFVAVSMHQDAMASVTGTASPDGLTERDDQADRLYAMIDRHFTRGVARLDEVDALGLTRPELFELWTTARELERVADHAEDIVAIATELDRPVESNITEELDELSRTARGVVENAVSVIVGDVDVETARQALHDRDSVRKEIKALERRLFESEENDYRLTRILDCLQRTAEHGGNIAERAIQGAIRRNKLGEDVQGSSEAKESEQ